VNGTPKLLLTIPQVAVAMSLGRSTVYELVQRGELPVVHVGRAVRVRAEDLQRFVQELES
jgi:putative molybdopterin biosynthesis protein